MLLLIHGSNEQNFVVISQLILFFFPIDTLATEKKKVCHKFVITITKQQQQNKILSQISLLFLVNNSNKIEIYHNILITTNFFNKS